MLSSRSSIVCNLYPLLKVSPLQSKNIQEVSGQENVVTIKFCNFMKLDGLVELKIKFHDFISLFSCDFFPWVNRSSEKKKRMKKYEKLIFLNTEVIFGTTSVSPAPSYRSKRRGNNLDVEFVQCVSCATCVVLVHQILLNITTKGRWDASCIIAVTAVNVLRVRSPE